MICVAGCGGGGWRDVATGSGKALWDRPVCSAGVRDAIHQAGAELRFLPPHSPDFNPIEMAFSKFKANLKRRAARTVTELWEAIAQTTDIFTSAECQNYFAAAGYDRK